MGHDDELVIADADFPAESCAKRLVKLSEISGEWTLQVILSVVSLDTYSTLATVMDLTDSDKTAGIPESSLWNIYQNYRFH